MKNNSSVSMTLFNATFGSHNGFLKLEPFGYGRFHVYRENSINAFRPFLNDPYSFPYSILIYKIPNRSIFPPNRDIYFRVSISDFPVSASTPKLYPTPR